VAGPFFQPLWRKLHKLALHRMNYGRGATVQGSGEEWVLRYLCEHSSETEQFTVFDVGAHVGLYTERVLSHFGERAAVYCFEPNGAAFEILTSRYSADGRVHCLNAGLSDKEQTRTLYSERQNCYMASMYSRHLDRIEGVMKETSQIPCTTIDIFCKAWRVENIDLLKIDVEGHELKIIEGASGMIGSGRIASIQFEFGDCDLESRTFFRDFFELLRPRYRLYRALYRGLWPLDAYDEALEIFKSTNYLAIARTASSLVIPP